MRSSPTSDGAVIEIQVKQPNAATRLGVGSVQDAGRGAARAARALAAARSAATSTSARW